MHLKESVIWKERKYGSMLYNVKNTTKMKLNRMGTDVFIKHFVRYHTVDEITRSIAAQYPNNSYDEISEDVKSLLGDIENSDFVTYDDEKRGFVNLLEFDPQIDCVNLEITRRCNLNCKHCFVGGCKETEELTTDEIMKLINELQELKVFELVITGGEPLLREDLPNIIRMCTDKNIRVTIFTNGILIDEEFINKIKDCYILIRFSLDGAKPETHDYIRGEGSFEKTYKAMKLCVEKGIDICIASTVWKGILNEYEEIVKIGEELGAKEVELSEVLEQGNAVTNKELILNETELHELRVKNLYAAINSDMIRKGFGLDRFNENIFNDEEEPVKEYCCNAGVKTCFVNSRGDLYPCTLFSKFNELMAGNLRQNTFTDIWLQADVFKKLRGLKIEHIKACGECECLKFCPGGCRAKAYSQCGELDGPMEEVFCNISRSLYHGIKKGEIFK